MIIPQHSTAMTAENYHPEIRSHMKRDDNILNCKSNSSIDSQVKEESEMITRKRKQQWQQTNNANKLKDTHSKEEAAETRNEKKRTKTSASTADDDDVSGACGGGGGGVKKNSDSKKRFKTITEKDLEGYARKCHADGSRAQAKWAIKVFTGNYPSFFFRITCIDLLSFLFFFKKKPLLICFRLA